MIITFLRRKRLGKKSLTEVQKILKEEYNKDSFVYRNDKSICLPGNTDLLIRWGTITDFPYKTENCIEINTCKMIKDVNYKAEARKLMQDNEISVPKSFFDEQEIVDYYETDNNYEQPLIGRKQFHSQGKFIKLIRNNDELYHDFDSDYWSEYIQKDKEYRVFTFFGKVICVAEKVPNNPESIAWNHFGGGSSFQNIRWNDWPLNVCIEAIKAYKLFGIDFCGIDVIVKDGIPYVLELNSAHTLSSEYRQKCFSKAVNWLIENISVNGNKPIHFENNLNNIRSYIDLIHPCMFDGNIGNINN